MKRTSAVAILLSAAGIALLLTAGCGVKSAPIPPEEARPVKIVDLRAVSVANGIELGWSRPTRYVSGATMRDLSSFIILRAEGNGAMEPFATVPVTDQGRFRVQHHFSFLDRATTLGDTYSYEVVARTSDGYESLPSNEVAVKRVKPPPPPNPATFKLPNSNPLPSSAR